MAAADQNPNSDRRERLAKQSLSIRKISCPVIHLSPLVTFLRTWGRGLHFPNGKESLLSVGFFEQILEASILLSEYAPLPLPHRCPGMNFQTQPTQVGKKESIRPKRNRSGGGERVELSCAVTENTWMAKKKLFST